MVSVRSIVYLLFMFLSTVVLAVPLSVLGWVLPYRWVAEIGRQWGRLNLGALEVLCGLSYRIHGIDKLPTETCIVLCKHQSAWETIALRALLPPVHTWVIKRELLWTPFFGWGIAALRPIAINRKDGRRAVKQLLREGQRWLNAGRWIVIFPEGTRVAPGERRRYGIGGALLAAKTRYPVLPIAHNAGVFWRRRDFRKHPGVIDLVVGELFATDGLSAAEINGRAEAWIESTVASLPQSR